MQASALEVVDRQQEQHEGPEGECMLTSSKATCQDHVPVLLYAGFGDWRGMLSNICRFSRNTNFYLELNVRSSIVCSPSPPARTLQKSPNFGARCA